jgi:hypothetical protein
LKKNQERSQKLLLFEASWFLEKKTKKQKNKKKPQRKRPGKKKAKETEN